MDKEVKVKRLGILFIVFVAVAISLVSELCKKPEVIQSSANVTLLSKPNKAKVCIVIDAGHGGNSSPGCIFDGVYERNICLQIAKKVKTKLVDNGYDVIMTREKDMDLTLKERIDIANNTEAMVFVSIHQNSLENDSTTQGIETWYNPNKDNCSKVLAKQIQSEIINTTGAEDKGIKESTEFAVIRDTKMASCLVETGFLSSTEERRKLCTNEYQNKIAEGIVNGIIKYVTDI